MPGPVHPVDHIRRRRAARRFMTDSVYAYSMCALAMCGCGRPWGVSGRGRRGRRSGRRRHRRGPPGRGHHASESGDGRRAGGSSGRPGSVSVCGRHAWHIPHHCRLPRIRPRDEDDRRDRRVGHDGGVVCAPSRQRRVGGDGDGDAQRARGESRPAADGHAEPRPAAGRVVALDRRRAGDGARRDAGRQRPDAGAAAPARPRLDARARAGGRPAAEQRAHGDGPLGDRGRPGRPRQRGDTRRSPADRARCSTGPTRCREPSTS